MNIIERMGGHIEANSLLKNPLANRATDFDLKLGRFLCRLERIQTKAWRHIINADEDIFLTFNYTHTLEKLYNAANVLHIHGEQESDDLLIGHGNPASYEEDVFDQDIYKNEMHDYLRKNTQECINQNSQFFEDLSNSDIIEIYSYGFSFGEVDLPYLKEIIRLLDTASITWYFHSFSKIAEREVYEDTLKRLGFEGDFSFF